MSSLIGTIVEDKANKAHYVIYHTDGNNPKTPTNTPCAYMVLIDFNKGWFSSTPQKLVTIPLSFLFRFYTKDLSRRPSKYPVDVLVPAN